MQAWFDGVKDLVDRFSALSPSACGGCQKDNGGKGDVNDRVFALHPLNDTHPEALRLTQRGVRMLHEGRMEASLQELHAARQAAPKSHEACSNLGCAYHMSGDDNTALYWYRQAHGMAPRDETAVLALAMLEQRRGQVMDAQKLLVQFLQEVDSAHVSALKQLGRLHQQQGNWSQAGGCFHRLISIEPTNNEWPAQLQLCLDQVPLKDDRGQTIQDNGLGAFARAFSFAEPILRQAVPADSREATGRQLVTSYSASTQDGASQPPARAPQTAECQTSTQSLRNAPIDNRGAAKSRSFASIQEESPQSGARSREGSLPRSHRSESHREGSLPPSPQERREQSGPWAVSQSFRMGADGEEERFAVHAKVLDKRAISSVNAAVEQLNKGIIQCPEGAIIVYSASGRAYFLLYRHDMKDAAYSKFKRLMEQAPPGAAVQLQEAVRLRGSGRSDAALTVYRNVLRSEPRNAEAVAGVVDCQCDLGDFDAAIEAAKQLIGFKPEDAEANLRVAEVLLASSHHPDSVEPYLSRAVAERASKPAIQQRMLCAQAEVALARDDFAKALTSAAEAVRVDSAARPLVLLGNARLRVAEYPAALRALSAALDACSGSPSLEARRLRAAAHMLSAQAHERQRQYPQALAQAQSALELRPMFGDARVAKAMALQQSGRGTEAEAELQQVLQQDSRHGTARLQLGYMRLLDGDVQAASTAFEAVITGSSPSRSMLGTAKVYLALTLAGGQQRAEKVLKEGLALHRNLQHVWSEIETSLATQPMVAVQRLRGICDLDLTSTQAKQLLGMLAQAHGRADIARALEGVTPASASQRPARAPSVPPNRWAPTSPADAVVATAAQSLGGAAAQGGGYSPQRNRSVSPAPWGAVGASGGNMQGGSVNIRGRSVSPGPGSMYYANAGGVPGPTRQRAGSANSQDSGSREPGPGRGRTMPAAPNQLLPAAGAEQKSGSTSITLGWDEVIRPEQIVLGQTLGSGGSGAVYRGSWNGQEVAVKKISGLAHLEEMKKEINALRRLRHPRLVRFIGACIQPPQLLVVTEFMAGGSLHDRLFGKMKDPPLTAQQRWQICLHMAEGLAFLHANRVVHRDLKTMNILLDSAQNAKICDFGLAHQMEATHIGRKTDGEGGSPRYMAPECYEASYGKLTEKVDIWAMGCIFCELFGNQYPYSDCQTMAQLSARILVERKPPQLPPSVPAPLVEVAKRCLLFDERRRINAGDLHAELGKVRRQLKMG